MSSVNKHQNKISEYEEAIRRLHQHGVMINGSFVYGMDNDTTDTFSLTTDWAIQNSIETATFHILTPYPGTKLYDLLAKQGRVITKNWDLYDTRHAVFQPKRMTPQELEKGYWSAYNAFYKWSSVFKSADNKQIFKEKVRHLIYTAGWKKFELLWYVIVKTNGLHNMVPVLEKILNTAKDDERKATTGGIKDQHKERVTSDQEDGRIFGFGSGLDNMAS